MNHSHNYPEINMINNQVISMTWKRTDYEPLTQTIHSLSHDIRNKLSEKLTDIVPCYNSITIFFKGSFNAADVNVLNDISKDIHLEGNPTKNCLKIPVCFEDIYAPDMPYMSKFLKMEIEDIVEEFCSKTYTVAFLGFLPGFPYLNGLSQKLVVPRKSTPSKSVSPGAVGIAGKQAGIYPQKSPGGWNIIGNCPITLFDPANAPYALFQPGDQVKFFRVDQSEYEETASENTDLFNRRKILLQHV